MKKVDKEARRRERRRGEDKRLAETRKRKRRKGS